MYSNDSKLSDRHVWANSIKPDQTAQSDQGLHSLPFRLYLLDALLHCKRRCSNFRIITTSVSDVRIFRIFTVRNLPGLTTSL